MPQDDTEEDTFSASRYPHGERLLKNRLSVAFRIPSCRKLTPVNASLRGVPVTTVKRTADKYTEECIKGRDVGVKERQKKTSHLGLPPRAYCRGLCTTVLEILTLLEILVHLVILEQQGIKDLL
jgi:hypothetical protein